MLPGTNKTALITGASAGIGYELTHFFAADGFDLVLIARNDIRLREIADELFRRYTISVKVIAKDLAKSGSASEVFETLKTEGIAIDILVNNAGFGLYGQFADTALSKEQEMIQLNITSLTELTKLFLDQLGNDGKGRILNVASTAAFQPGPMMAVYFATKAYVLSFSEALSNELKDRGVSVTCLCPGPTKTEFERRAEMPETFLFKMQNEDAKSVAECGYKALMKGETVIIPGLLNRILTFSVRITPRSLVTKIVRRLQSK